MLVKAVTSVIEQTFHEWEVIIVDDGSTDDTAEKIKRIAKYDQRIRYTFQRNAERSVARNNGIAQAKGKYICFLDSDDKFEPNRLQLMHDKIAASKYPEAVFYTAIRFYHREQEIFIKDPGPVTGNIFDFLYKAVIGTPQLCIHHSLLAKESFNPNLIIGEDFELLMRLAHLAPFKYLSEQATVIANEHGGRTADLSESYLKHIEMLSNVLKMHKSFFSDSRVPKKFMHDALLGLARSYATEKRIRKMNYTIFQACSYSLTYNLKEKIVLILLHNSIFIPFKLFYRRWLKK